MFQKVNVTTSLYFSLHKKIQMNQQLFRHLSKLFLIHLVAESERKYFCQPFITFKPVFFSFCESCRHYFIYIKLFCKSCYFFKYFIRRSNDSTLPVIHNPFPFFWRILILRCSFIGWCFIKSTFFKTKEAIIHNSLRFLQCFFIVRTKYKNTRIHFWCSKLYRRFKPFPVNFNCFLSPYWINKLRIAKRNAKFCSEVSTFSATG